MNGAGTNHKVIRLDYLTRVEGEASLTVKMKGGSVADVKLRIFEPPRFFEALLQGRKYTEAPDITARICGICPAAYQMAAVHAMECALGIHVDQGIRNLRRLLTCGEWIQSHALHVYMLHAPDFLGCSDVLEIARKDQRFVKQGLKLKQTGNRILQLLGGREIHPVNVRVGGFYRIPSKPELETLLPPLRDSLDIAAETVQWSARLQYPELQQAYRFLSLQHSTEYPMNEGHIAFDQAGTSVPQMFESVDFEKHVVEEQVPYSNAMHANADGAAYLVGPLARYSLNFERLSSSVKKMARELGLGPVCYNPFQSILIRSLEILYACEEAIRIVSNYEPPANTAPDPEILSPARGCACIEAPRGILYHSYELDTDGNITKATIIPPTSQNQKVMEKDVRDVVIANLQQPQEILQMKCEQAIRNFDPCISCATHFLRINMEQL